jgi:dTDP-4-dehydrorhamnose reductase
VICISRKANVQVQKQKSITWEIGDLSEYQFMKMIYNKYKPAITLHAGGEGSVDLVEKNPLLGEIGIKNVSQIVSDLCVDYQSKLIYVSSNAVFGNTSHPISDWAEYSPINKYGVYKMEAEQYIRNNNKNNLIVRPIVMYGINHVNQRDNPMTNWIKKLSNQENINVVDDVFTQPLYAEICAKSILKSIELDLNGEFNISGGETLSLYRFAIKIAEVFGLDKSLIRAIKSYELEGVASRPKVTEYIMETYLEKISQSIPSIEQNLKEIMSEKS